MAYFGCSDDMSVDVKEIDGQHKRLGEMANVLYQAMPAKKGREVQKATIDAIVAYAATHSKVEEKCMQQY